MCKILLSINPEHVDSIISKKKTYEFRKTKCKQDIDKIVIYATAPISKVIGEVDVLEIIEDIPENVWDITGDYSGISKEFFEEYYRNREKAVAYKLGNIKKFKNPKLLKEFGINFAPQSFVYI